MSRKKLCIFSDVGVAKGLSAFEARCRPEVEFSSPGRDGRKRMTRLESPAKGVSIL